MNCGPACSLWCLERCAGTVVRSPNKSEQRNGRKEQRKQKNKKTLQLMQRHALPHHERIELPLHHRLPSVPTVCIFRIFFFLHFCPESSEKEEKETWFVASDFSLANEIRYKSIWSGNFDARSSFAPSEKDQFPIMVRRTGDRIRWPPNTFMSTLNPIASTPSECKIFYLPDCRRQRCGPCGRWTRWENGN